MTQFKDLPLPNELQNAISDCGYTDCTPVQDQTFAATFQGKDVLVQSQTGTGKTAAFLISILHHFPKAKGQKRALILAPTRELALQIEENAKTLSKGMDVHTVAIVGGVSYNKQHDQLTRKPDILIGTPGRLIDLSRNKKIYFRDYNIVVIDEADRLLEMGFQQDLNTIMRQTPKNNERHTMMFSATINHRVKYLTERLMNNAVSIHIAPKEVAVSKISQSLFHVAKNEKMGLLLGLLKTKQPSQVLIFTNMKQTTYELYKRLDVNGIQSEYLTGDLPQKKRNRIIQDVQNGAIRCLIATDIAARGLHIENLPLVINYDLPSEAENYVHRIGRTGRAGQTGEAISFSCEEGSFFLEDIEKLIKNQIPIQRLTDDMILDDKSKGQTFRLDYKSSKPTHGQHRQGQNRPGQQEKSGYKKRSYSDKKPSYSKQRYTKPHSQDKHASKHPQKRRPHPKADTTAHHKKYQDHKKRHHTKQKPIQKKTTLQRITSFLFGQKPKNEK